MTERNENDVYGVEECEYVRKTEVDEDVKESRLHGLKDRLAQHEDVEAEVLRDEIANLEARIEELTEFKPGHGYLQWQSWNWYMVFLQVYPHYRPMREIEDETLKIRLQAFVGHIDSIVKPTDEGGRKFSSSENMVRSVGGNFIFDRQYIVPPHLPYHELSLDTLKRLPRYLTESVVRPSAAVPTTLDHFRYWAWTAAMASRALEKDEEDLQVNDFQYTIHMGLFPIRVPFSFDNTALSAISSDSERFALLSGLAVLEGFICNYGSSLTPEGYARKTITEHWKPEQNGSYPTIGNGQPVHKYHDILQIWRQEDAGDRVSQTLSEINDLNRYDVESLKWKFDDS